MDNSKSKPKAKTTIRKSDPASSSKTVKTRKVSSPELILSEDEIRIKAQAIYNERISKGVQGTAEDDWLKAERLLKR
jgi:hypothetical protein